MELDDYLLPPLSVDGGLEEVPVERLPAPVRVEMVLSIASVRAFSAIATWVLAAFSIEFAIVSVLSGSHLSAWPQNNSGLINWFCRDR